MATQANRKLTKAAFEAWLLARGERALPPGRCPLAQYLGPRAWVGYHSYGRYTPALEHKALPGWAQRFVARIDNHTAGRRWLWQYLSPKECLAALRARA